MTTGVVHAFGLEGIIKVTCSNVGSRVDLAETFEPHDAGPNPGSCARPEIPLRSTESFEKIERGEVIARHVFDFRH